MKKVSNETLIKRVKERLRGTATNLDRAVELVCDTYGVHDRYRRKFITDSVSAGIGMPAPPAKTRGEYYWEKGSLA
jgi:hypothetical protein